MSKDQGVDLASGKTSEEARNEQLIRSLSLAEGKSKNTPKFVPLFTVDGYFYDAVVGKKYFGNEIGATVRDFPYRTASIPRASTPYSARKLASA
jgi:hypothetical protein